MIYWTISIAAIIIIVALFFVFIFPKKKKRIDRPSRVSEDDVPEVTSGSPETATATRPLAPELSALGEDDKLKLMNAVWYRCENPYCNFTEFLDVHHIISEVEGGSNRLNNLIVLCPKCHQAADNHEIPEDVLQAWILQREERFKFELDWPYK